MRMLGCIGDISYCQFIKLFPIYSKISFLFICALYIFMQENQVKQNRSLTQVRTNSILFLNVPQKYKNKSISFRWLTQNKEMHPFINILTRFDINKISDNNYFHCTPLDYGLSIIGRVVVFVNGIYQVVQETKFGPVLPQIQVEAYRRDNKYQQIKICFVKNVYLKSKISIISGLGIQGKNSKVSIKLTSKQLNFQICFDHTTRVPSNNSFFKFYINQQNCLGISTCHQHSQLVEKLKHTKYAQYHFGLYLKIQFASRISRDAFLYQLLESLGINIISRPTITINQQKTSKIEVKKIQHQNVSENLKKKQIDDEIYQLLYDNQQVSQAESLDMGDAELLLSSNRLDPISRTYFGQIEGYLSLNQQRKAILIQKNFNNTVFNKQIDQILFDDRIKNASNSLVSILNQKNVDETIRISCQGPFQDQAANQNQLKSTITFLKNQVKTLMKQNRKLTQQNKRLKDENIKLRYKQIKSNLIKTKVEKIPSPKNQEFIEKERSNSISPLPRQPKTPPKLIQISDKNDSIKKKKFEKSKQNSFKATSSTGSILIVSPKSASKYSDKASSKNYVSFSSVTNREFIKNQQKTHQQNEILQHRLAYGITKNSLEYQNMKSNPQSNNISRNPSCHIVRVTNLGSISSSNHNNLNLRR